MPVHVPGRYHALAHAGRWPAPSRVRSRFGVLVPAPDFLVNLMTP